MSRVTPADEVDLLRVQVVLKAQRKGSAMTDIDAGISLKSLPSFRVVAASSISTSLSQCRKS